MKIDREQILKEYLDWINKVSEDNEHKTHFEPKEIVFKVIDIIESKDEYSDSIFDKLADDFEDIFCIDYENDTIDLNEMVQYIKKWRDK